MLIFLDESGVPHPNDPAISPVIVSVCINREDARTVSAQVYSLKRRLGTPDKELKGAELITRRVFDKRPNQRELVEAFFDLCRNLPFTLFAIVMEHPAQVPHGREVENYLPNEYRYLLQRINRHAEESGRMASLLFDGEGPTMYKGMLPKKFDSFLYRSLEGQSFTSVCDSPYFVNSRLTQGIQIADMMAYVCRIYHENNLREGLPQGDSYLSAINRYYNIIKSKAVDITTQEGYSRPGIYFMPESDHYKREYSRSHS